MTHPSPTILALVSAPLVNLYGEPVDPLNTNRELAGLESWLRAPGRAKKLAVSSRPVPPIPHASGVYVALCGSG